MTKPDELLKQINLALNELSLSKQPVRLYEPIRYVLSMGGKRMRPTLCLLACELFSDNSSKALSPALALEIFHNFTLLHDDIMDKAPTRRNMDCVHIKWDDNVAILSGDAMQILAYEVFGHSTKNVLEKGLQLFTKTALEVCEGQQFDMDFETQKEVHIESYMNMIRLKTAVLIAASLKLGAIAGGASDTDAENLYQFGINIGLAFQLMDDYLDVYGETATFGKRIGGDIICNKKTFLLIHALNEATGSDKTELEYWINQTTCSEDEKIKAVTSIYNQCGIPDKCIEEINRLHKAALDTLNKVAVEHHRKAFLIQYTNELIERNK
jgi:geranylgeranyl diphosphate synthase, type II